jgi:uncharacterized protein YqhQ
MFAYLRESLRLFGHIQLLPVLESGEETLVGGQAVMEGVMMRAPHSYCVAVRKKNGEIVTEEAPVHRMSEKYPIFKLPIFRGVGTLVQALGLGMKALQFSANVSLEEEGKPKEDQAKISGWAMTVQMIFSFAFFAFMYKYVPLQLTDLLKSQYPVLDNRILYNGVDGIIRIAIFLTFLFVLSRFKDINRVFQFHGAEHKVVFNFEARTPVTVENAQRFVTWHPRCGTSFLLVVMLVSMIVYMFLPFDTFVQKLVSRIVLIPVIAGLSYEIIRFAAKRRGSYLALLTAPGLWLQRITTQPPDDDAVAVAIHALDGAMALETKQGGELVIA